MQLVSLSSSHSQAPVADTCAHCGAAGASILFNAERFCCQGCARVRSILKEQGLLDFYEIEGNDRLSLRNRVPTDFGFCDTAWFSGKFITPIGTDRYVVTLKLPAIHCAACVWLLEKLPEMLPGVTSARINYLAKELRITAHTTTPLSLVAKFVSDLGYDPDFAGSLKNPRALGKHDRKLLRKLAVAAFGFGNAMLFSLPEYFSLRVEPGFAKTFIVLNVVIATAVLIFSAGGFFKNAWAALKQKKVILDLPISIGIAAMFAKSTTDIATGLSSGYADTFCGLIFFLLIGRYVQSRSFAWLNFERDNLLFLPLAVRLKRADAEIIVPVQDVQAGDRLRLLAGETLPMRATLLSDIGEIDYAFITGESQPVVFRQGETLEAGGKLVGQSAEFTVLEPVDQAKLNRIWQEADAQTAVAPAGDFAESIIPYFTAIVLVIAVIALVYWLPSDAARAFNAFCAVLVITCPCALAMAKPFAFFTTQSALSRQGLYLKTAGIVQKFWNLGWIVFDKTGTLTNPSSFDVEFVPARPDYNTTEFILPLAAIAAESTHPLSRAIDAHKPRQGEFLVSNFSETPGQGLSAVCNGRPYLLGSLSWLAAHGLKPVALTVEAHETAVHAAVEETYLGYFAIHNTLRPGLEEAIAPLKRQHKLALISGDTDRDRARFHQILGADSELYFGQSPEDKARILQQLKQSGRVMMVGDGLNDASALASADLGVAITENHSNFSPASDAILAAQSLTKLPRLISLARQAKWTAITAYAISFAYNIVGVSVAVTGSLTPLYTAILMPISSLTVISLAFVSARAGARLRSLN